MDYSNQMHERLEIEARLDLTFFNSLICHPQAWQEYWEIALHGFRQVEP